MNLSRKYGPSYAKIEQGGTLSIKPCRLRSGNIGKQQREQHIIMMPHLRVSDM